MCIAGTQAERRYKRSISSIYQLDSLIDTTTAAISLIEVVLDAFVTVLETGSRVYPF